jgi:two-component system NtrC family sensor kinase/two-component system sensor histidine kinase AtoS
MDKITPQELNLLIEQTYKVEEEFNELKASYAHLQDTIENVVEFLPNAVWILERDGSVFLQNSKARELSTLLNQLQHREQDYEIAFQRNFFLIKSSTYKEKVMFSATDITEQKRKENLATMGQMAAHLSHEIRNPIGSIALLSSTLKKRVIAQNVAVVEEIQKSVYRIERIIKATLMFSKGVDVKKSVFMWSELHEALDFSIEYYAHSKDIQFCFPQNDFQLLADKDLLDMLLSNLIINAIDAIELNEEDEGIVEITYHDDGVYHIFCIYDSGVEIEDKDALFEAFHSTKVKGNGLGLVLSSQIAQAHGGSVNLLAGDKKGFEVKLLKE